MKRKLIAALLSMSLLAGGVLSGCGNSGDSGDAQKENTVAAEKQDPSESATASSGFNEVGYPIVNEPLTLKIMLSIRDIDSLVEPNEMPAIQRLEEQTGIHIEWETVKGSDWNTKLNLMFASGEYPDIILASDGHKYSVGYLVAQNINTNAHYFINTTWLDELNLEMPTNIEELTDTLRAFKEAYPDGVPLEMGVDTGYTGVRYMLPMFGIPVEDNKWIYLDDNKQVQLAPIQQGFRDCMEWLHTCYTEGLTDPEILSQDDNTINSKLKDAGGKIGFFLGWRLTAMGYDDGVMQTCGLYTPDSASLYRILELAKEGGGAFLTATNEHVAESLRWLDAMLETETMFSLYYGEKDAENGTGWVYNKENGKIDVINNNSVDVNKTYLDINTLFFAPSQYISEVFNMSEQRIEKTEYCEEYEAKGILQKYSNMYLNLAPLTSEQLQSVTLKETDIDNAVWENVNRFIKDGVTDDSWDAFVETINGMNVDEYTKMYQDAIDTMDLE